ncbi:antibiotic biosynthesis monooxygenase [Methylomonas sp. LL1]|uniref:putative quinol monooxygenase n=1 Tax=Methylomonas sp. LL1 TaxID=2785785 RepID=UPI0018C3DA0A|nr:antibiotic biosynthesis monooxygenase [Methylomonas sp. LL1]QPK63555.1 antibiotic biosynthesis monooxygenase [Methylomonas sp. LL1]
MIELHLVLRVPANKTRTMVDALQVLAKSARSVPGCIAVEVYKTVGVPRYICYDEIWESETMLRKMIASSHFSQLASLMELSSEPPDCEFRFISQTCGLDFAERVRGCATD